MRAIRVWQSIKYLVYERAGDREVGSFTCIGLGNEAYLIRGKPPPLPRIALGTETEDALPEEL